MQYPLIALILTLSTFSHAEQDPIPNKPVPPLDRFAPDTVSPPVTVPFPGGKFTLGENETVVFAGGTNFVREAKPGELEALLTR